MSVVAQSERNVAIPPPILMRRWTVDEYHRMIAAGVFAQDERFELLEGWIVPKVSRNPPHDAALDLAQEEMRQRLPSGWRIRVQSAITTSDSEPEPDVAVVPGTARTYAARHPGPADIALIVEVADWSLAEDRRDKARLYARAGIAVYWIVNLVDRVIEVYTDPTGPVPVPVYRARRDFGPEVVSITIGGQVVSIPVSDILP